MLSSSLNPDDVKRSKENPYVFKYLNKPLTLEKFKNLY